MPSEETAEMPTREYSQEFSDIEELAEQHAPGILEVLDVYGRAMQPEANWQPMNAGGIFYATDTKPHQTR
jgi:hypothetical protein